MAAARHERCFSKLDKVSYSGSKADYGFVIGFFERSIKRNNWSSPVRPEGPANATANNEKMPLFTIGLHSTQGIVPVCLRSINIIRLSLVYFAANH